MKRTNSYLGGTEEIQRRDKPDSRWEIILLVDGQLRFWWSGTWLKNWRKTWKEARGRQVTGTNARVAGSKGRAWDKAVRVGTGGSLVHTAEQLQVEERNDGRHSAIQKRKNGNWGVGWLFLHVIVQFPSVVLHVNCVLLNSSALPCESGLGFSGRCCRNKVTNSSLSSDLIWEIFQIIMWLQKTGRTSNGKHFVLPLRFLSLQAVDKKHHSYLHRFFKRGGTVSSSGESPVERYKKVCSCISATAPSWMSLGNLRWMLWAQRCELLQSTSIAKELSFILAHVSSVAAQMEATQ